MKKLILSAILILIKIPLLKHEFLVRTEYKYGINSVYHDMDSIYNRYYRFSIGYKL